MALLDFALVQAQRLRRREPARPPVRPVPFPGAILEAPGEEGLAAAWASTTAEVEQREARERARRARLTNGLDALGLLAVPTGVGIWLGPGQGLALGGLLALWVSSRLAR